MRRLLAISVLGVTMLIAMVVAARSLASTPAEVGEAGVDTGFFVFLFAGLGLFWGLGALIVVRADGHVVGWLFAVAAAMTASVFASWGLGSLLASSQPPDPLGAWFWLAAGLLFPPASILILPAVALTFPTGTLPGPRWRWPVRLIAAMVAVRTLAVVIRPGPTGDGAPDNPLTPWLPGFSPSVLEILRAIDAIGNLSILLAAGLGVAAILVRFRRSHGDQRQQLKWFLAAMTLAATLLPISLSEVASSLLLIDLLSAATLPIIAVSVAIAILRYRLYDIDRIVSRTIAYATLTGILVVTFAGAILLSQAVLAPLTGGSTVGVAASTLIVAALFQPLRRRVQRVVDRRFNRARYDAERTLAAFAGRLREQVDLTALRADLLTTVARTLDPAGPDLWLRDPGTRSS